MRAEGITNVTFQAGDLFSLPFVPGKFRSHLCLFRSWNTSPIRDRCSTYSVPLSGRAGRSLLSKAIMAQRIFILTVPRQTKQSGALFVSSGRPGETPLSAGNFSRCLCRPGMRMCTYCRRWCMSMPRGRRLSRGSPGRRSPRWSKGSGTLCSPEG